jgi:hypothetical protein
MEIICANVDVESFREVWDRIWDIKREAAKLIHARSKGSNNTGEAIYALADKADAALTNLIDPFSTAPAAETKKD